MLVAHWPGDFLSDSACSDLQNIIKEGIENQRQKAPNILSNRCSCEPRISEAMPCFARAVLTVDEQFFEGVDMAGENDRHVCRIISGS